MNPVATGQEIVIIQANAYGDNNLIITLDSGKIVYMDIKEIVKIEGFNRTIFEIEKKRTRFWLKVK